MLASPWIGVGWIILALGIIDLLSPFALGQPANDEINQRDQALNDYRLAGDLYQQQKWTEAAEAFRRAATSVSGTALATYAKYYEIECLAADGQAERALPLLKNWLTDNETHAENSAETATSNANPIADLFFRGQYRLAELSVRSGEMQAAMGAYQKVITNSKDASLRSRSLLASARIQQKEGRLAEAQRSYTQILDDADLSQWHPEARLGIISLNLAEGKGENAMAELEQLAEESDSGEVAAVAALQAAQLHYTRSDFERALPLFVSAEQKSKSLTVIAAAKIGQANTLYATGKKEEAIAVLDGYVGQYQTDPYWTQNYYQLIRWQLAAAKLEDAARGLARLQDVGFATAEEESQWQRIQSLYFRVGGRNSEAAEALLKAIEKAPAKNVPELRKELLAIRLAMGDQKTAIKELTAWEQEPGLDSSLAKLYSLKRLEFLVQQKKWPEAMQGIERWLNENELDSQRSDALVLLAQCKIATAEIETARKILSDPLFAAEATSDSVKGQAQWLIGETYLLQKDYLSAVAAYSKVANSCNDAKWQAYALLQAGKCYEITGQTAEATQLYEQGLQIAPLDTLKKSLQQRLNDVKQLKTSSLTPAKGNTIPSTGSSKR